MGKIGKSYETRLSYNREVTMPLCHFIPNGSKMSPQDLTQKQRFNIRLVMEHLGIENTTSNWRKYSEIYDWDLMAENIRNPKYIARCDIVYCGDVCGSIAVEIAASSEAEFFEKKNKFFPAYRFKEFISVPIQNKL